MLIRGKLGVLAFGTAVTIVCWICIGDCSAAATWAIASASAALNVYLCECSGTELTSSSCSWYSLSRIECSVGWTAATGAGSVTRAIGDSSSLFRLRFVTRVDFGAVCDVADPWIVGFGCDGAALVFELWELYSCWIRVALLGKFSLFEPRFRDLFAVLQSMIGGGFDLRGNVICRLLSTLIWSYQKWVSIIRMNFRHRIKWIFTGSAVTIFAANSLWSSVGRRTWFRWVLAGCGNFAFNSSPSSAALSASTDSAVCGVARGNIEKPRAPSLFHSISLFGP